MRAINFYHKNIPKESFWRKKLPDGDCFFFGTPCNCKKFQKGEKPYKVVKARPKLAIPKEKRVPLTLDVYGYWQTEPYIAPEVVDVSFMYLYPLITIIFDYRVYKKTGIWAIFSCFFDPKFFFKNDPIKANLGNRLRAFPTLPWP